jgi:predicted aspartyl protease
MRIQGAKKAGRFAVDLELANNDDVAEVRRGHLPADKIRRVTIRGVVDSGAARLVLPKKVVKELGLPLFGKVRVRCADGRRALRNEAQAVYLKLQGRDGVFKAVVEPKRDTALIGAIVVEDLDFVVDCTNQRLVPRDPHFVVSEIE